MIGITIGDANGVGPEILLRSYKEKRLHGDFFAIGDFRVLKLCREKMSLNVPLHSMCDPYDFTPGCLNILDAGLLKESDIIPGQLSEKTGYASLKYVETGTKLALENFVQAIVTLPVNKEAVRMTRPGFSGHTGFIASLCKTENYTMMLISDKLIVSHVSTHVPYLEAVNYVKRERIYEVIRLTGAAMQKLERGERIAVAGLNPHAGENNSFGTEDSQEILPAVLQGKEQGFNVTGPVPADTVFYQAAKGEFDVVICMYHDQGHIPLKLLAFESAVNVTLGLPVVRTSVDHGTAFDIAWKGTASVESFVNAFSLAAKLAS
jgi:4-phospho-D-threonate 3-dehydrogenase / 4-phospho-D-erythronate 3-dehydrogenase